MNRQRSSPAEVSVVLATHVDSPALHRSLASVLAQTGVELELIVVGDGDPAGVARYIATLGDTRIRYSGVTRGGLTRALQHGCELAQHALIARLDVGDIMHAGRLVEQARILESDPSVGLVASDFAFYTEEGYYLYQSRVDCKEVSQAIRHADIAHFKSPAHASVMFKRSAYVRVGGYRSEFYYAQDCDLWIRMLEHYRLRVANLVLTSGVFSPRGISGQFPTRQRLYLLHALKLRERRRKGETDDLREVSTLASEDQQKLKSKSLPEDTDKTAKHIAQANFFLAKCLMVNDTDRAAEYFKRVLVARPTMAKAWYFAMLNQLRPKRICKRSDEFNALNQAFTVKKEGT